MRRHESVVIPPRCIVYHPDSVSAEQFEDDPEHWRPAAQLLGARIAEPEPAVLIVDESLLGTVEWLRHLAHHVTLVAADEAAEDALHDRPHASIAGFRRTEDRKRVLRGACMFACARLLNIRRRQQISRANRELRELNQIGTALMTEHDLAVLLRRIVQIGKELTQSDGGLLLLARNTLAPQLIVGDWVIDSLPDLAQPTTALPVDDNSIIGHAARTQTPIVIEDAYDLPPDAGFVLDRSFDEQFGYRRRSMLIVPMVDHQHRLVGVLCFVNRKTSPEETIRTAADADRCVLAFSDRELRLARSLAGQAAVSIENAKLYAQIEHTLESVVEAAVSAIDQRDPATAGHSVRVAELAVALAQAVEQDHRPPYEQAHFSARELRELRYASLLHDVGKVVVREEVLTKAKKLTPVLWERVRARFDLIRRTIELESCRAGGDAASLARELDALDRARAIVFDANEPTVQRVTPPSALREIAHRTYPDADGRPVPYLTEEELHYLELPQGTLDDAERAQVEAHVNATNGFLTNIPWTDDLKDIATFAYGHHEKLDGTGYPRRLQGDEIPLQTRIITLADMFDALTESDRPYKPAVAPEVAIDILRGEADAGRIDRALVDILADSRVYEQVLRESRRHEPIARPLRSAAAEIAERADR